MHTHSLLHFQTSNMHSDVMLCPKYVHAVHAHLCTWAWPETFHLQNDKSSHNIPNAFAGQAKPIILWPLMSALLQHAGGRWPKKSRHLAMKGIGSSSNDRAAFTSPSSSTDFTPEGGPQNGWPNGPKVGRGGESVAISWSTMTDNLSIRKCIFVNKY